MAAVLVVIHHAGELTGVFSFAAGRLGVEFFFVLSGIVILLAHWDDIGDPNALKLFVWKRFRRIYPVYWVVLLPQLAWIVLRPRQINLYQRNAWVILSSIILVHLNSVHTTITVAWTLFHEILFYAFFASLLLSRRVGIVVMTLWLAASIFFFYVPDTFWGTFFSPLHLIFAMGMAGAWAIRREAIQWPMTLLVAGLLIFGYACYRVNANPVSSDKMNLLAGFGALLTLLGLVHFETHGKLKVAAWLSLLGDASYSIYLIHYPFLYAFSHGTLRFFSRFGLPVAGAIVLLTLCAISSGIVFHLAVERPLIRWFRVGQPALRAN